MHLAPLVSDKSSYDHVVAIEHCRHGLQLMALAHGRKLISH